MSLEATFEGERAEVVVAPPYGRRVVFVVEERTVRSGSRCARFIVGLKGSTQDGFSSHSSFDAACRSLLYRARRYDRAYSVPRGIQRQAVAA